MASIKVVNDLLSFGEDFGAFDTRIINGNFAVGAALVEGEMDFIRIVVPVEGVFHFVAIVIVFAVGEDFGSIYVNMVLAEDFGD